VALGTGIEVDVTEPTPYSAIVNPELVVHARPPTRVPG
jgi:hypothetical protein